VALRKEPAPNDLWSARFGSTGEASGCNASVGQEARAASAAGDGSPRGPVVLTGGAFLREPSSAGSDGIDICRAGEGTEGHPLLRALPRRRCQKGSGSSAILGRSVQIGTFTITELVKSNNQHEPVPRQVHPRAPLNRTGIFPTPCGCAAGTGAQRPARSDTSRLFGGPSWKKVSVAGRKRARVEAGNSPEIPSCLEVSAVCAQGGPSGVRGPMVAPEEVGCPAGKRAVE
jgi:hypothetical protein